MNALLADWLATRPNVEVIGRFRDVKSVTAEKVGLAQHCDLMVIDMVLPDGDGLDVIKTVNQQAGRQVPVVIITGRPTRDLFDRLYTELEGAWALLLKGSNGLSNLEHAIEVVRDGLVMVDPQLRRSNDPLGGPELTAQELAVMTHVANGSSNATVADRVFMSEKSVERILHSVYKKYGIEGTSKRDNPRVKATLIFLGLSQYTAA